ncbi:unnamed protein product [Bursaphelenchus xylophilus]|uniref:(pine wood nematode) hypothetical protein n=1 Tax=Bursaphelenchus xylophilus TaxID=6326 RepID=A0A7I8XIR2_BURXY|nr:unnamed protein product [Bursaphelenchus xylophilus]CAG9085047.1 unnamed protein product [Bursaphelenchus xylophilus]
MECCRPTRKMTSTYWYPSKQSGFSFETKDMAQCIYQGITAEDYSRRELSLQFQIFQPSNGNSPKEYKTSIIQRFPACTLSNPEVQQVIWLDSLDETSRIILKFFYNGDMNSALILNRLDNSESVRNECCICLSLSDGFLQNDDIVIQGELWYDHGEILDDGNITRHNQYIETSKQFRTLILSNVRYEESIVIRLPVSDTRDVHLRLTLYDVHDNIAGVSYLKIINDGVLLTDGRYDLNVYNAESPNEIKSHSYLGIPSLRRNLDVTTIYPDYNLLSNGYISCCACSMSSYLSQNKVLMQFLRANDENELNGVIPTLCGANPFDFKYLMPQVMDKCFFLLRGPPVISQMACDFLTCIFHWHDSELYRHITDAVNECLSTFRHPSVDSVLMTYLKTKFQTFNANPDGAHVKLDLIKVTGCLPKLIEFMIAARVCNGSDVQSLATDFEVVMKLSLASIKVDKDIGRHIPELAKMIDPLLEAGLFDVSIMSEYVTKILETVPEARVVAKVGFIGNILKSKLFHLECRMEIMEKIIAYMFNVITLAVSQPRNSELMRLLFSALFDLIELIKRCEDGKRPIQSLFIHRCFHPLVRLFLEMSRSGIDRNSSILLISLCDMCNAELWLSYSSAVDNFRIVFEDLVKVFTTLSNESSIPASWETLSLRINMVIISSLNACLAIMALKGEHITDYSVLNVLKHINHNLMTKKSTINVYTHRFAEVIRKLWKMMCNNGQIAEFIEFLLSLVKLSDCFFRGFLIRIMTSAQTSMRMDEIITKYWEMSSVTPQHARFWEEYQNVLYFISERSDSHVECIPLIVHGLSTFLSCRTKEECQIYSMISLVQLIRLSKRANLGENWLKSIYHLHQLYINQEKYVEAGKLLILAADEFSWTDTPLSEAREIIASILDVTVHSERELKQLLHQKAADYFEKDQLWELAIDTRKQLIQIYENVSFEYDKIPDLMTKMGDLYRSISTEQRMEHHFFLVGFYGDEQPQSIRNKHFVFRGQKLELWDQFKNRILHEIGGCFLDIMNKIDGDFILHPSRMAGRHISIVPVVQIISSPKYSQLSTKNPLLSWYYKHNNVSVFELHRPFKLTDSSYTKHEVSESNTIWIKRYNFSIFSELPGFTPFDQLSTFTKLNPLNPLQVALYNLQAANEKLQYYSLMYKHGFKEFEMALSGQIRGILQADVGGGIHNYMKLLESPEVCKENREDISKLLNCVRSHISILEGSLEISQEGNPDSDLIKFMASNFKTYKIHVEEQINNHWQDCHPKEGPPLPPRKSKLHSSITCIPK